MALNSQNAKQWVPVNQRRQGKHRSPVREVVWLLPHISYCLRFIDGAILRMHAQLGKADTVTAWAMSMFTLAAMLPLKRRCCWEIR